MRKGFLIVLAVVLVAAMAAPAMAGTRHQRVRTAIKGMACPTSGTFGRIAASPSTKDAPRERPYVEQRLRGCSSRSATRT